MSAQSNFQFQHGAVTDLNFSMGRARVRVVIAYWQLGLSKGNDKQLLAISCWIATDWSSTLVHKDRDVRILINDHSQSHIEG